MKETGATSPGYTQLCAREREKSEWRWKGPVGAARAEEFAEELFLLLEAANAPNMVGQWETGSYVGDHALEIECELLPRLLDFMRLLVMAAKPSDQG